MTAIELEMRHMKIKEIELLRTMRNQMIDFAFSHKIITFEKWKEEIERSETIFHQKVKELK